MCVPGQPWIATLLMVTLITATSITNRAAAFDPVSVESEIATIRLSVLGTHRGGMFSRNSPTFPVYDPVTERLFIGSVDRLRLDALDISRPDNPTLIPELSEMFNLTSQDGPNRIAFHDGVIAVATEKSSVAFFNTLGTPLGSPVPLPGARQVAFTPDGTKLVVTVSGEEVEPGTGNLNDSGIAIFDFSAEDWESCKQTGGCDLGHNPVISPLSFATLNGSRQHYLDEGVRLPFTNDPFNYTVGQDLEPGPLTISDDSQTAWITFVDNNAIMEVDLGPSPHVVDLYGLGAKDNSLAESEFQDTAGSLVFQDKADGSSLLHPNGGTRGNGFDASDRDGPNKSGMINIRTWPMKTFYEPDSIGMYTADGKTYLVTANEGDPRTSIEANEDDEIETVERLKDLSGHPLMAGVVDPIDKDSPVYDLQGDADLGRLKVSVVDGDTNGDGDIDELYSFGTRSFSIWSSMGELAFDSGDDFEQIPAMAVPDHFNASDDQNDFDARSDDRGPEPEVLDMGTIGDHTYVFVGNERIGGIMVYDVTDPLDVRFEQYINNRDFIVDINRDENNGGCIKGDPESDHANCNAADAGDLEPEGILFIPGDESPIDGVPLLAVTHELSDSVTLYRIDSLPAVPEPSTLLLGTALLLGLVAYREPWRGTALD